MISPEVASKWAKKKLGKEAFVIADRLKVANGSKIDRYRLLYTSKEGVVMTHFSYKSWEDLFVQAGIEVDERHPIFLREAYKEEFACFEEPEGEQVTFF